jgi:hypothetical protein
MSNKSLLKVYNCDKKRCEIKHIYIFNNGKHTIEIYDQNYIQKISNMSHALLHKVIHVRLERISKMYMIENDKHNHCELIHMRQIIISDNYLFLFIKYFHIVNMIVYVGLMIDSTDVKPPQIYTFVLSSDSNVDVSKKYNFVHLNVIKQLSKKDEIIEKITFMKSFFKSNYQPMYIYNKISIL